MSSVWVIEYAPSHVKLPLIFQNRYDAVSEANMMCSLYNTSKKEIDDQHPSFLAKKLLTDLIFKDLNILTANISDFIPIEIKKMSAKTKIELHEKLYKMISQIVTH